jgi:ABC-type multidrug transport system ATPase subunit
LIEYIKSEDGTVPLMMNNAAVLSRSDRALLHIVRAFIYNPEVLVIHNPTLLLDRQLSQVCLDALRAFVDERGLEMPVETRRKRRPRTVIFSTSNVDGVKVADKILFCHEQKVRFVSFEEVSHLFSTGADGATADTMSPGLRRQMTDKQVIPGIPMEDKPAFDQALQEAGANAIASPVAPITTTTTTMTKTYTVSTTVSHAPAAPVVNGSRYCCEPCIGYESQDLINPGSPGLAVEVQPPAHRIP